MDHNKVIVVLLMVIVALLVVGFALFNPFMAKSDTSISVTSPSELNEGDELSILLIDSNSKPIANQTVQINITDFNNHVEQKTATTNEEGVGVISLAGFSAGQYRINVTYDGNNTFKPSQGFENLNIKQVVTQSVGSTNQPAHIVSGFSPSYQDGNIVYGYKDGRFGFVTPSGSFHEI